MGNKLLPLFVVWLCFTSFIYAANTFTVSVSNLTVTTPTSTLTITASQVTGPVTVTLSITPSNVLIFDSLSHRFETGDPSSFSFAISTVDPAVAGKVSVSFSLDNTAEYGNPSPVDIYVLNSIIYPSHSIKPGATSEGTLSLLGSPYTSLQITLTSSSPGVFFTPSVFSFFAGQPPYELKYTVTSKLPGTYFITPSISGPDADLGLISTPLPNTTVTVGLRTVTTNPSDNKQIQVAEVTPQYLVFLDIAPENSLTVNLYPTDPNVIANPSSLLFTPTTTTQTYVLTSSKVAYASIVTNCTGPDADKYQVAVAVPTVTVTNRTINTPTINSLLLEVTSAKYSIYVPNPPSRPLTLTITSNDNLVFSPSTLIFDSSNSVGTFTITAFNTSGPTNREIVYSLSGDMAYAYTVPARSFVSIQATKRNVAVDFTFDPDTVPYNASLRLDFLVDNIPPNSFTVKVDCGVNSRLTHDLFTFTNSPGTLQQSFTLLISALGSTRCTFTIGGTDQALVNPIPSILFTVVQYLAPQVTIGKATVGVPLEGTLRLPSPVISGLTVSLIASPSDIEIEPSVFNLAPTSATDVSYPFLVTAPTARSYVVRTVLSGPDVALFPSVPDNLVEVLTVSFDASQFTLDSPLTVNVPIVGLVVKLSQPHLTSVTLTPKAASLVFNPPTLVFDPEVSTVCVTVTPTQVIAQDAIVWTSSDPTNYVAPATYMFGPIVEKTFDIGVLSDPLTLIVGVTSAPYPVSLHYPPTTGTITLSPASTDGVVFNPTVLTFTPTTGWQHFTLTASSLNNRNPVVTWTVGGAEASTITVPAIVNQITVNGRALTSSGSFGSTLVNTTSTPIVITSDYAAALTITPTAADLEFYPPSQSLSSTVRFVAFTAKYTTWKVDADEVDVAVQFALSGPNAEWYAPLNPVNFHAVKRTITNSVSSLELTVGKPGTPISFVLEVPTEQGLSLTFCAPNGIIFTPSVVVFAPGQSVAYTTVSADDNYGQLPASASVGVDVIGFDADIYSGVAPIVISDIYTPGSIALIGFPSEVVLGDAPYVFEISVPLIETSTFTVTPISQSGSLTFVPSSVTFNKGKIHQFLTVQATNVFHNAAAASPEVVTFHIDGDTGILGTLASTSVVINKRSITSTPSTPVPVGTYVNSYIQLAYPPASGTITLQAVSSPNLIVIPTTLTFTRNSIAYFAVSGPSVGSFSLAWQVSGQEAAFYSNPQTTDFSFTSRTIQLASSTLVVQPGKLPIVSFTLSNPAVNGLTVTPVGPSQVVSNPPSLTLSAGQSIGSFVFRLNGTNLYTDDTSSLNFLLSGPDARWYSAINSVGVSIAQGDILVDSIADTEVGVSTNVIVTLSITTINGLSLTPISPYASFSPSVINFVPGSSSASFRVTPSTSGELPIGFTVSGPDSWLYSVPTASVNAKLRTLSVGTIDLDTSQKNTLRVYVSTPAASLVVTPVASGINFAPPSLSFSSSTASQEIAYLPTSCGSVQVDWQVSGSNAGWFDLSGLPSSTSTINVDCIDVDITLPSSFAANVRTSGRAQVETPVVVSITPSAPSCTFTPNVWNFNKDLLSVSYVAQCNTPAVKDSSVSIPVSYTVTGPDANFIAQPIISTDIKIVPNVLTVPQSAVTFSGQPVALTFTLTHPPAVSFTLTPWAPHVTFNPPSFIFQSGTSATIFATPTSPTEPGTFAIEYQLSGPGSAEIGLSAPSTQLNSKYGSFNIGFSSVSVGHEVGPYAVIVTPTPTSDLALTPYAPGCFFAPGTLHFGPNNDVDSCYINCNSVGSVNVQFNTSGTAAGHYAIHSAFPMTVGARLYLVDLSDTTPEIFDERYGSIRLNTPADQGLTITPHSSVLTFDPPTIVFPPGSTFAPFKFTGTAIGSDLVWFEEGDDDADFYDTFAPVPVTVGPRVVTSNILGSIYTGAKTNTFQVILDRAPNTGLLVRPYGAGAVFTPETLNFQPGQKGLSCVVQVKFGGVFNINYNISGPDAQYYAALTSTLFSVQQLTAKIDISNYENTYVGVRSPPLIVSSNYPPSDTVVIDLVGDGFEPSFVEFSPTVTSAVVYYTPQAVGKNQITAILAGNAAGDYADNIIDSDEFFVDQRLIRTPDDLPDLYAGVESVTISFGVDYPPPTEFTITPTAANCVFTPSVLSFTAQDYHKEFTFVANQAAQFNNAPDQSDDLSPTTVSYILGGADAAWFGQIPNSVIHVMPRDININYSPIQHVNIPFNITITTTYPSSSDLVLTLTGSCNFTTPTVTLEAGETSVIVGAIPLAAGDGQFRVVYSGDEAGAYQRTGDWPFLALKWNFDTPDLDSVFLLGEWGSPVIVRPSHVPDEPVTLTLSSEYLEFDNTILTFDKNNSVAQYSFRLRAGIDYLRIPGNPKVFNVYYWVGGPSAWLFSTPSAGSFSWELNYPPRSLSVSNFPDTLVVGVPSAPITVAVPNFPFDKLTITPIPYSHHVHFNPPFITLSRDSYSYLSTFTVTVDHPGVTGIVKFLCTDLDAVYYDNPEFSIDSVETRTIQISSAPLIVGTPSNPFIASIEYPISDTLSVILSSPFANFEPSTVTFGPNVSSVAFSVTANTYGNSIPVTISTVGPALDWFTPASLAPLSADQRIWLSSPNTIDVKAGQPTTVDYSVKTAPNSGITITPHGVGLVFSPASITLDSSSSSATFTVIAHVSNLGIVVKTTVTGPNAAWYTSVPDYFANIYPLNIWIPNLDDEMGIDLSDQKDLLVQLDAPTNGLNFSLFASNLQFDQPWYYVPAGHGFSHASFVAVSAGLSTVTISLNDGGDAAWYSIQQPDSAVRVHQHYLATTNPSSLHVGTQSGTFALFSYGGSSDTQRAPPSPVTVNFLVSPSGAADIVPQSIILDSSTSAAQIQVTPNIPSDNIIITPILSGPGAAYYRNTPGSDPNPFGFASIKRTFTITDPFNSLAITNQRQLFVGERSHKFGVTCNGVPTTDVSLHLSGPGLQFIPSVIRCPGTFETMYFEILPQDAILTQITYSVGGADARFYTVPPPSAPIRVTHLFEIPSLQPVNVGVISAVHTITIASPITSAVYLTPSTAQCASSISPDVPNYVTFFPPFLLFTPNTTTQSFTYIGNCASNNLGNNINPVITKDSPDRYNTQPNPISVTWKVSEAGEEPYTLSFPYNEAVLAVAVLQIPFKISFAALTLGTTSSVTITIPVAPRSDVILTLVGNNLNFNPPHAVFSPGVLSQTIEVTFVHRDFKDSKGIPFTVDYIVSGTNWQDYIPPAQSFVGVSRGDADVIGGICGSDAGVTGVSVWIVFVVAVLALVL